MRNRTIERCIKLLEAIKMSKSYSSDICNNLNYVLTALEQEMLMNKNKGLSIIMSKEKKEVQG